MVVGFVTEGVGKCFGGAGVGDGVAEAVEVGVNVPEGEGAGGLLEDAEAEGAELAADYQSGVGGGRRERFFMDGVAPPAAAMVAVGGAELFVDAAEPFEQRLALLGEVQEVLVDALQLAADVVFFAEEAFAAGVGDAAAAAKRDEVAAVDDRGAGDGFIGGVVGRIGSHG
jgi:hypothetical protein